MNKKQNANEIDKRELSLDRRNIFLAGTALAAASGLGAPIPTALAQGVPATVPPSPNWARAMAPGPDASVKITEAYARRVARDAYPRCSR